jgi:import inner membrane translocase subunit TIM44
MLSGRLARHAFNSARGQIRANHCHHHHQQFSTSQNYLFSQPGGKPQGFIGRVLENIKQEFAKNKEMQESIAKFRDEAQKLEESEALKKARRKFEIVESEASKGSEVFKEGYTTVKGKFQEVVKEASESEFAKKASQVGGNIGKHAQSIADNVAEQGAKISSTQTFRAVSDAASIVREEIVDSNYENKIYKPPAKLRKRVDTAAFSQEAITPDDKSTGIELHKDSKFYQSWEKFKESNPYVNKMLDWKIQYDESEHPVIRASRVLTNKVSDIMGGLFQRTELSETLTEIMQLDPTFDKEKFIRECERDIIPNILEAMCRSELEILEDWCYEAAYAVISQPLKAAKERGLILHSKVLDMSHVDLAMGRVLEQGPVLVITFQAQQIQYVVDKANKVVEGDPDKILRVNHAWVLCRDPTELNPKSAWRLLEFSMSAQEQLL